MSRPKSEALRLGGWLLLSLCAAGGCLHGGASPRARAPAAAQLENRPATPITADQVNESNARQMAQRLSNELDREAQGEPQETPLARTPSSNSTKSKN